MTGNAFLSRLALLQALLLAAPPPAAAKIRSDWSKVRAVEAGQRTWVQLYEGEAREEDLLVKGRFESATAESITLMLSDGQTRTFKKQAVRKVLIGRPFANRVPGWAAMGVTAGILETLSAVASARASDGYEPRRKALLHAMLTIPIGLAFFYGSRMGGIYNVPPKHRAKMQAPGADDSRQADQGGPP